MQLLKHTVFAVSLMMGSHISQAQTVSQAMRDLQTLAGEEMQGREIGSEGSARARTYILQRLKEIGLKPCGEKFEQEFEHKARTGIVIGRNILACQSGSKGTNIGAIVISAHYDHLGSNRRGVYFGADDNASGVAGVLALAEHYANRVPQHTLVYAFFDGEEQGLVGAKAFLKHGPVSAKSIAFNINFDMIGRGDKNELYVSGTHYRPELKTLLSPIADTSNIKVLFGHDRPDQGVDNWTPQSDHFPFFNAGIPHLYFGVEDHADYHQPTDTSDKIKADFFDKTIAILKQTVQIIDGQWTTPLDQK
ncbi:M20/M25/M40 family metallo-hydrolase [Undibacterium fentianense]|uniref:M20/M25/M40 family metallo-hydrolase n=1 Tax=Undibacterium fentianense TaxID=2828728 RepID=A0A941DYV4_9BURK|nr:M20/M25/M40 family metallo-hydrolase [Undibacterium fentianense]MBR7799974.1 M20/M25/M40 family metallo-hydrolase [Undibacterium fentianense]